MCFELFFFFICFDMPCTTQTITSLSSLDLLLTVQLHIHKHMTSMTSSTCTIEKNGHFQLLIIPTGIIYSAPVCIQLQNRTKENIMMNSAKFEMKLILTRIDSISPGMLSFCQNNITKKNPKSKIQKKKYSAATFWIFFEFLYRSSIIFVIFWCNIRKRNINLIIRYRKYSMYTWFVYKLLLKLKNAFFRFFNFFFFLDFFIVVNLLW